MQKKPLGRTGLNVTDICLGTMTWGLQNTETQGHEQMDYALDAGINFFDTAEMYAVPPSQETYGKTEEIIGTWFRSRNTRDKIILATKAVGPGTAWIRGGSVLNGKSVTAAIDASLNRLQTDYIDLYQLHWPTRTFPHFDRHGASKIDFTQTTTELEEANLLDILQALGNAVKSGKIRHVGLSNDTAWGIMKYLELAEKHGLPRMASIQNEFSVLNRHDDPYVAEVCVREDVAYLPWSPLAGGALSGKYIGGARPEGTRWAIDNKRKLHRDTLVLDAAVKAYMDVAKKHGLDVCAMGIAWCRAQNFVTSTIIGATSMAQLKIDMQAATMDLKPDVIADIDAVYREYPMPY
ncbi:MAG TPA: aldo/keto reductase [Alphaproteobacteria bacterium]